MELAEAIKVFEHYPSSQRIKFYGSGMSMTGKKRKAAVVTVSGATVVKKHKKSQRRVPASSILYNEVKYSELYISNSTIVGTMLVYDLNDIGQGDNYNQRNGNQVLSKYLQYNFQVKNTGGAPVTWTAYIVLDRQCNSGAPTGSDVLDTSIIGINWAMKNIKFNQERFKILRHYFGSTLSIGNGGATDTSAGVVSDFIDLRKLDPRDQVVRYNSTSSGPPQTNGLFLLIVTDNVTSGNVSLFGGFRWAYLER